MTAAAELAAMFGVLIMIYGGTFGVAWGGMQLIAGGDWKLAVGSAFIVAAGMVIGKQIADRAKRNETPGQEHQDGSSDN